jgi:AcrR family transcriptional regulator
MYAALNGICKSAFSVLPFTCAHIVRPRSVPSGLRLFIQHGYRKTSIDDIAQAARVAKRTVYLHFENKAAVFLAILKYLGD